MDHETLDEKLERLMGYYREECAEWTHNKQPYVAGTLRTIRELIQETRQQIEFYQDIAEAAFARSRGEA